jgi:hypothetical protein
MNMRPAATRKLQAIFRLGRLLAALAAAAVVWACGPVYIPVPPPNQVSFTSELVTNADGSNPRTVWIGAGGPNSNAGNALFYLFDEQRKAGVITTALPDGSFQAPPMEGTAGDHVLIYYQDVRGRDSDTGCVILSDALPAAPICQ